MTGNRQDWRRVRLGEIAEFRNGVNYTKDNFGEGVKVINVKDFQDYTSPKYETLDEINPEGVIRDAHLLRENDVVFVRSNGNRELIGRSLALLSVPTEPVTHSAFTIRARLHPKPELNPRFYAYVFRSGVIRQVLSAHGSGANISNLNQDILDRLVVPLPPRHAQDRIAAILSAYDDLIENNTRRIAILEEMARRLYEEWFVHFRFPGHEEVEFAETELGTAPNTWQVQTIAETFKITGGGTPSKKVDEYWADGTIDWYSPTDLTKAGTAFMDGSSSKITPLGLQKSSARLFPPFSVMMTSRATIGAIAINTTEACTNQGFITCLPNRRFPLYVLMHWLRENVEMFINLASGATFKEISKGVFKEIKLLVPSQSLVDEFERFVAPMMQTMLVLQRKNANLRAQRDLLLPKLVSGEIDVSEAEEAMEVAE